MKTFFSIVGILGILLTSGAAEPPKRSFEPAEGSMSFPVSENLIVSATKVLPDVDPTTGMMKGLAAEGNVVIKVKPKETGEWIVVACDKAVYDLAKDQIVLTGWPAVKAGVQLLRSTSKDTYAVVSRKDGKWEIKGDHKLELNLGALKKKAG